MADSRMKGRVKGLLAGPPSDRLIPKQTAPNPPILPDRMPALADPEAQRQALQVLTLAQRTADDHVAAAQRQAETVRADARTAAEQIVRDAQEHAEHAMQETDQVVSQARLTAEQIIDDAQAEADNVGHGADKVLADAQAMAAQTINGAQAAAADLEREAKQRYEEAIGGLAEERAILQQQIDGLQQEIDALEQFDREYRTRLRVFMHSQLRALDEDEGSPPADLPAAIRATTTD